MKRRYPSQQSNADNFLKAALERGHLVKDRLGNWSFGRRGFNGRTVNRAIAKGVAVRDGNIVRLVHEQA